MIAPIVQPIRYFKAPIELPAESIKEFNIADSDKYIQTSTINHTYDHIRQNKLLASKVNKVRSLNQKFKRTILSKNNEQNLRLMLKEKESQIEQRRKEVIAKNQKWDRFRENREIEVDRYIKQRKI